MDYREYLERKAQIGGMHGFDPLFIPKMAFPFQEALIEQAFQRLKGNL